VFALGKADSFFINGGVHTLTRFKTKNGWVVFDPPPGAPQLTNEIVEKWENEDYEAEYRRAFSPRR